jgi:predicted regulator of Ras-like GTPase activity (Roadblock/LC7/MglB family)
MTSAPFAALLADVGRVRGVSAAMVVGEDDGLIVRAALPTGMRGGAVAALAASLYRKARRSAGAAGFGEGGFMQLDAERGRVCAVGRAGLVLVAVADLRAPVGLIRVAMLRGRESLG